MLRNKLPFYQNVNHVCTKSCKFIVCLRASTLLKGNLRGMHYHYSEFLFSNYHKTDLRQLERFSEIHKPFYGWTLHTLVTLKIFKIWFHVKEQSEERIPTKKNYSRNSLKSVSSNDCISGLYPNKITNILV